MTNELWLLMACVFLLSYLMVGMFILGCSKTTYMTDDEIQRDIDQRKGYK